MADDADAITLPEIVIADYDPSWPHAFEAERARLSSALGDSAVEIEHVGSTAVTGLAAKPIIDIAIGVRDYGTADELTPLLEALGYVCCGEAGLRGRLFFRKGNPRTHHLHVVEHGGEIWERTLLFRDLLRADSALAEEYAALKRWLAFRHRHEPEKYGPAKEPFIESVLDRHRCHS